MIPKLTETDLLEIEKFVPETAQNINETLENLCVFVKELLRVFPENEFVKISKLSTLLNIAPEINKIHPGTLDNQELTFSTKNGDLLEINFKLMIPTELEERDNYFAYISLSLGGSGMVFLSIDDKSSGDSLKINPFYEKYFRTLKKILKSLILTENSSLTFLVGNRSFLKGELSLKDALFVLKTIHRNGFTIAKVPKN